MTEMPEWIKLTPKQQAALDIIGIVDYDYQKCLDPNYNLEGEEVEDLLYKLDKYYEQFQKIMRNVK